MAYYKGPDKWSNKRWYLLFLSRDEITGRILGELVHDT
jgi:hypothetical protein